MGFPVWDASVTLPLDEPARCDVVGEDDGRPVLVAVGLWRNDQGGRVVHTKSFNPAAPMREREIGPRWQPRSMAGDVAQGLVGMLAEWQRRPVHDISKEVALAILRGEAQVSTLTIDGVQVPATRFEFVGGLTVEASNDPALCVAVATLGVPVPALVTADPSLWRAAAVEAVGPV